MNIFYINFKSVRTRLNLVLIFSILIILGFLLMENTLIFKNKSKIEMQAIAHQNLGKFAAQIKLEIEKFYTTSKNFSEIMAFAKNKADSPKLERKQVNSIVRNFLKTKKYLHAIGMFWEPNAFDNADDEYIDEAGYGKNGTFTTYFFFDTEGNIRLLPYTECYIKEFYTAPKKSHKGHIVLPHISNLIKSNHLLMTYISPIIYHGRFFGIISLDASTEFIEAIIDDSKVYEGRADISIITSDGTLVASNTNKSNIGKNLNDIVTNFEEQFVELKNGTARTIEDDKNVELRIPIAFDNLDYPWQLRVVVPIDAYLAYYKPESSDLVLLRYLLIIIVFICFYYLSKYLLKPISELSLYANHLSAGNFSQLPELRATGEEIRLIKESFEMLKSRFVKITEFAKRIGTGDLNFNYEVTSKYDTIGQSLIEMRNSLKRNKRKEQKRKEEDAKRNWTNKGIAIFNDLLRQQFNDVESLSYAIIRAVIIYLKANQGGIFIYNDDDKENSFLELVAAIAYDERRYLNKKIHLGDGLLGTCAIEKKTIYISNLPEDYVQITSGLGESTPKFLLAVPLVVKNDIFGVVEIASFHEFKDFEIEFVERLAESIAVTISTSKINQRTARLLKLSQEQAREMAAQEEEMRQNLEELTATQEELERKQIEMEALLVTIDKTLIEGEYNVQGTLIRANDNYLSASGFRIEDVVGKNVRKEIPQEEIEEFNMMWDNLMNGISFRGETKRMRKNGEPKWFRSTYVPVRNKEGRVYKIFYIAEDITEMKHLEQKLAEQENILKELQGKNKT